MLNQRTFVASMIIQPVQQTLLMHHTPVASVWCILQVIPFTPSAGVLEWVDGTVPLLEYLLGSTRAGGAHGRYGAGDWTFMACREHMSTVSGVFTPIQKSTLFDTHFSIRARDDSGCKNSICD
jgi:hypothetical protein